MVNIHLFFKFIFKSFINNLRLVSDWNVLPTNLIGSDFNLEAIYFVNLADLILLYLEYFFLFLFYSHLCVIQNILFLHLLQKSLTVLKLFYCSNHWVIGLFEEKISILIFFVQIIWIFQFGTNKEILLLIPKLQYYNYQR